MAADKYQINYGARPTVKDWPHRERDTARGSSDQSEARDFDCTIAVLIDESAPLHAVNIFEPEIDEMVASVG